MRRVMCGVPPQNCSGSSMAVNAWLGGSAGMQKVHVSHEDAFKCYARYLVNIEGYERISSREFRKAGQPILVIRKQSRFGAELRGGKRSEKMATGDRVIPVGRGSGVLV